MVFSILIHVQPIWNYGIWGSGELGYCQTRGGPPETWTFKRRRLLGPAYLVLWKGSSDQHGRSFSKKNKRSKDYLYRWMCDVIIQFVYGWRDNIQEVTGNKHPLSMMFFSQVAWKFTAQIYTTIGRTFNIQCFETYIRSDEFITGLNRFILFLLGNMQ